MRSINQVNISGRLLEDPRITHRDENSSAAFFRIAINEPYMKEGERKESMQPVRCATYEKGIVDKIVMPYMKKGTPVAVINGKIRIGTYQNGEGQSVPTFEIIIGSRSEISLLPNGEKAADAGKAEAPVPDPFA